MTNKLFLMEVEKASSFISSQRKEQIASADRSDKIRTYNFPQSRITGKIAILDIFKQYNKITGQI